MVHHSECLLLHGDRPMIEFSCWTVLEVSLSSDHEMVLCSPWKLFHY